MNINFQAIADWYSGLGQTTQVFIIVAILYGLQKGLFDTLIDKIKGNKKPKEHNHKVESHSACNNFPSLKLLVKNAIDKAAQIQYILLNETLSDQMNEVDELFVDIREILKSHYMTLYRTKKDIDIAGLLNEIEVLFYITIVDSSEGMLKGLSRRFLKKNHFLDKSEEEFRIYVSKRAEDYRQAFSSYLDERYNSAMFTISREELFEWNMEMVYPNVLRKVEEFFYRVRTISLEKRQKVKELEEQIRDFA